MLLSPLLRPAPTDEQRRANDASRPVVVFLVLAVLAVYLYAFTGAGPHLGLPAPQTVAERAGLPTADIFDGDGNFAASLWMDAGPRSWSGDKQRMFYFLLLAAAFVCVYWLPVRRKRDAISAWTALIFAVIYGVKGLAFLLLGHATVYLILHPDRRRRPWLGALPGALAAAAFSGHGVPLPLLLLALPAGSLAAYRWVLRPLALHPRAGPVLRTCAVQSLLLTTLAASLFCGGLGANWALPVGVLLFFGHWMRLMLYHADYKDGLVPKDISLRGYLANFLCPAVVPRAFWATVSQGYAYTESVFLSEDKNRIALGGVQLLLWGLFFMTLGNSMVYWLAARAQEMGVPSYWGNIAALSEDYLSGVRLSPASVLVTSFLQMMRFAFFMAGIAHFKVGVWRLFGFQVAPHFNNWFGATNFVDLWSRFSFHRREFLVRAFYYPAFFRFRKLRPELRSALAVLAALGVGHLFWIRGVESLFYDGPGLGAIRAIAAAWPYEILLGTAIACSQVYLMRRGRRRRPWTSGAGLAGDVLAAYLTLQTFALLQIFGYASANAGAWDRFRILMIAFGVRL